MRLITRFQNLSAIPSYHHHPIFGREVVRTIKALKPAAIALEISEMWSGEFEWGASLWPSPVVSYANNSFLPVVPGDSMVEACRLAKEFGIPLFFVDFALADIIDRPNRGVLPDAALAPRVGSLFIEANDAIQASAGPPAKGDVAREAHMAARLAELMEQFASVLWVGGMAHWSRIRDRLAARAFDGPQLRQAEHPVSFKRMRLEWSALYDITQRLPFQLTGYSRAPTSYDESRRLRQLALAAVEPDKHEPVDVAAMLVYARNIEALENLSESPGLWQLLTAASSCLGNEYASRLATLALTDRFNSDAETLPLLTHCIEEDGNGKYVGVYRCEGQILEGQSLFGSPDWTFTYRRLPSLIEIKRRERNTPAAEVKPAVPGDKKGWASYPEDDLAYEAFVRYLLEHLSASQPDDMTALRFVSGMGEGVDVRETIRHLREGDIYVREPQLTAARARNGLIDYTSHREDSWILQQAAFDPSHAAPYANTEKGGWIDPSLLNVGSASWNVREPMVLQKEPFRLQRTYRELSLITLDAPTSLKVDDTRSFYWKVIKRLISMPSSERNLYGWLRIMFDFCRNKPFAYFSRYKPGPRVYALAREFGIRIIHVPLAHIPQRALERHQSFQFMNLTRAQWDELLERISEAKRAWTSSAVETDYV